MSCQLPRVVTNQTRCLLGLLDRECPVHRTDGQRRASDRMGRHEPRSIAHARRAGRLLRLGLHVVKHPEALKDERGVRRKAAADLGLGGEGVRLDAAHGVAPVAFGLSGLPAHTT